MIPKSTPSLGFLSRLKRRHVIFMCVAPLLTLGVFILKPFVPNAAQASPSNPVPKPPVQDLPAPPHKASFTSLRELMQDGLSVPYGELSVYARQDGEFDAESVAGLTQTTAGFKSAIAEIPALAKRNFTSQDREFFLQKAAALTVQADELSQALRTHSPGKLSIALDAIDNTCQSCHSRLAPHLTQKK